MYSSEKFVAPPAPCVVGRLGAGGILSRCGRGGRAYRAKVDTVRLNCFEHVFMRLAFHAFPTKQLFYRVLTHFRQGHRLTDANCANFIRYRGVTNYPSLFFRTR